jgi:ectoine hydroxylase-related dioxygenase (phytanoyl-CoA dioxygenase family)
MLRGLTDPRKPHPAEKRLTGSAGTVFILNIHCGHSAVHNSSNEPRLALMANFSRRNSPLVMMNPAPDPAPEALARHTPDIQRLLTG